MYSISAMRLLCQVLPFSVFVSFWFFFLCFDGLFRNKMLMCHFKIFFPEFFSWVNSEPPLKCHQLYCLTVLENLRMLGLNLWFVSVSLFFTQTLNIIKLRRGNRCACITSSLSASCFQFCQSVELKYSSAKLWRHDHSFPFFVPHLRPSIHLSICPILKRDSTNVWRACRDVSHYSYTAKTITDMMTVRLLQIVTFIIGQLLFWLII